MGSFEMKGFVTLLGALLLVGCQLAGTETGENDPKYPWWELVFVEPNYMRVWVEDSSVQDISVVSSHQAAPTTR
jgi:hypothetical protein